MRHGIVPLPETFEIALKRQQQHIERVTADVERAVIWMIYGNRGAHKGVLVEHGDGWTGVSLREPEQDSRVVVGAVVYTYAVQSRVEQVTW